MLEERSHPPSPPLLAPRRQGEQNSLGRGEGVTVQRTENGSSGPEGKAQGGTTLVDGVVSNPVVDTFPWESHSDADHLKLWTPSSARVGSDPLPPSSSRHSDHLAHSIQNSPTGASSGTAAQISPRPNEQTGDGVEGTDTNDDGVDSTDTNDHGVDSADTNNGVNSAEPKQKSSGQDTDNSRASMGM
jgi:hypothetical protein